MAEYDFVAISVCIIHAKSLYSTCMSACMDSLPSSDSSKTAIRETRFVFGMGEHEAIFSNFVKIIFYQILADRSQSHANVLFHKHLLTTWSKQKRKKMTMND